jgi:hypothetical protein
MADSGPPLDTESMASGDPIAGVALDAGAQGVKSHDLPRIRSDEDFTALPHGAQFVDPDGQTRYKPIRKGSEGNQDYLALPEGVEFVDPEGNFRTKPRYEPVDFTAQTLYDIAHSDKGRKMALEKFYPGKVREDPSGGFYIEDEGGKLRKPGRGLSAAGGFAASEAIPGALGALGSALGAGVGTLAEPGGGTAVGGAAGAYGGGYMGQRINDIFSQLAGVYDPEGGEENARMAGMETAAGDVGGRALFAVAPTLKEGARAVGKGAAKAANKFLGTNPEALETALPIAEAREQAGKGPLGLSKPGTAVSPSAIFESSPHLTNVAEILQQKFDRSDTYRENAERFMDKRAKDILASKDIGAIVEGSLTHPTAAVPTEKAGILLKESAQAKAVQQSAEADARLQAELANRRAAVEAKHAPDIEAHRARNSQVIQTAEQAKTAADNLVQEGFQAIERQANDATRVAQVGHNAGDLWRSVAESFVGLRRSIAARAQTMYGNAHIASNGLVPPGADTLAPRAQALLDQLPEGFAASHPAIVRRIAAMAGEVGENGEVVREPTAAAWSELHELRTMIRQDIKWNDLTSDVKNGALKHMQNGIDEVLHSVENQPELREASRLLNLADDFYRENMGPLNDRQIKLLVKALDSGQQADPKALLKVAIQDGKTETANTIRNTVGPQTWDAVRAADVQEMLAQSRQLDGSIDGLKFANMVEDRFQNGVLNVLHGDQGGARLRQQALYIKQLRGKLPISARPGDTANDVILRARSAAADAENLAKTDPLKALSNEMKKVEAATRKEFAAKQKPDPLGFLTNATVGANAAVDKILGDPDLIVAAARAFPGHEKSPEFQLMRQIWTERFMRETLDPGEKLAATSPEIQALMFPGVTLDDMHMLAKEMKLLMSGATTRGGGGDLGGSIMAQSAVENPLGRASGLGKLAGPMKVLPGVNFGARAVLTAYYNTVRGLLTSPSTLRWLRKGLQSRDPAARDSARAELRAALQRGGMMGSATGSALHQYSEQPDQGVLE